MQWSASNRFQYFSTYSSTLIDTIQNGSSLSSALLLDPSWEKTPDSWQEGKPIAAEERVVQRSTLTLASSFSTYFHMKWNMWGHTFADIARDSAQSAQSTAWPFNVLRSLAIWKPNRRNWGYDLLLSAALRATNQQNGMEAEDLDTFIRLKMNGLFHYPKWLQGSFSYDNENVWQTYIQETLDYTFLFLLVANEALLALCLVLSLVVTVSTKAGTAQYFRLPSVVKRLAVTHGIVASILVFKITRLRMSEWGKSIDVGLTFMRPFPVDEDFTSERWETDPSLPQGKSTLPERMDVLFGTRYDSPWLGSYNRWLDFHPGNLVFDAVVGERGYLYSIYNDERNDPIFLQNLLADIIDEVSAQTKGGRLLQQDHLSGDWVAVPVPQSMELVRTAVAVASHPAIKSVDSALRYLIAEYRYGALRGSALAFESTLYLSKLRRELLQSTKPLFRTQQAGSLRPLADEVSASRTSVGLKPSSLVVKHISTVPELARPDSPSEPESEPKVGSRVMVYRSLDQTWSKGLVVEVVSKGNEL